MRFSLSFFRNLCADPDEGAGEGKTELEVEEEKIEWVPKQHEHRGDAKQVQRGAVTAGENAVVCP